MNIEDILNKRFSTRNLSDTEFNDNLQEFAEGLSRVDYRITHSHDKLMRDWQNLCKYKPESRNIASTSRIGMKLCEHFFPNFYEIKDSKGRSFNELWQDIDLLKKILIWNRKSHSTPYLSELKRGIYFCSGATKSTMYRPQMAKIITCGSSVVFDPCAGWGGRMLGSIANGCKYYAFEPNTQTYNNLQKLVSFLNVENMATIINDSILNFHKYNVEKADVCLTSPPYFDLEKYCEEKTQSINGIATYDEWIEKFLDPVIKTCIDNLTPDGKTCWNVASIGKYKMWDDVNRIHMKYGYAKISEYIVGSSARQVNQSLAKNKKTNDMTVEYRKNNE